MDFTTRRFSFGQPSFFLDVSGGQGEKDKEKPSNFSFASSPGSPPTLMGKKRVVFAARR